MPLTGRSTPRRYSTAALTHGVASGAGLHGGLPYIDAAIFATSSSPFGGTHLASLTACRAAVSCSRSRLPSCNRPAILASERLRSPSGIGGPATSTLTAPTL